MDGQLSFATLDYAGKKKRTKRDVFLAEMAAAVPWSVLETVIAPYEGIGWQGIGAPKNTPADVIDKLNGAISAGLADPKFNSRFTDLGAEIFAGSPADFGRFIVDYTEKWAKVIRAAGVKAE